MLSLLALLNNCNKILCELVNDCIRVTDRGGYNIIVNNPRKACTKLKSAMAPLANLSSPYTYLGPKRIVIEGNEYGQFLATDLYTIEENSLIICRPRLGCERWKQRVKLINEMDTNIHAPYIMFPSFLARRRIRLFKREFIVEAPWICVEGASEAYAMLCAGEKCIFTITANGKVIVNDEAYLLNNSKCRYAFMERIRYGMKVLANKDLINIRNPPVFFDGTPLPLMLRILSDNGRQKIEAILWNPLGIATHATLRLSRLRALNIHVVNIAGGVERVKASDYGVHIPISKHSIVKLYVDAQKTLF